MRPSSSACHSTGSVRRPMRAVAAGYDDVAGVGGRFEDGAGRRQLARFEALAGWFGGLDSVYVEVAHAAGLVVVGGDAPGAELGVHDLRVDDAVEVASAPVGVVGDAPAVRDRAARRTVSRCAGSGSSMSIALRPRAASSLARPVASALLSSAPSISSSVRPAARRAKPSVGVRRGARRNMSRGRSRHARRR